MGAAARRHLPRAHRPDAGRRPRRRPLRRPLERRADRAPRPRPPARRARRPDRPLAGAASSTGWGASRDGGSAPRTRRNRLHGASRALISSARPMAARRRHQRIQGEARVDDRAHRRRRRRGHLVRRAVREGEGRDREDDLDVGRQGRLGRDLARARRSCSPTRARTSASRSTTPRRARSIDGVSGLLDGFVLLSELIAAFWTTMGPPLKRPKARGNLCTLVRRVSRAPPRRRTSRRPRTGTSSRRSSR